MKILHIITGLPSGGAEGALYRLVTADKGNHSIVISLMDEGKYGPLLESAGVELHMLNMARGKISLSSFISLIKLIKTIQPDLVQTWMYHADFMGGIAARLAGVKKIVWGLRHTDLSTNHTSRSTRLISYINSKLSYFIPSKIIACADRAKQVHIEAGYAEKKIIYVPNGYDLENVTIDLLARKIIRKELDIGEEELCIGMVARYNPQKDHLNLIKAVGILKNQGLKFKLLLIGPDIIASNAKLTRDINEAGISDYVRLLGPRSDVPAIMNSLDVHVLSSAGGEGFPNVLCEAMLCGTRCVSTDVGDAAIIIGETGEICQASDSYALADALAITLKLPNILMRNHLARQRIIDNFSIEKMVKNFNSVWNLV
ncbi:MAG: glycosyl transferase family 1 [Hyphomicrobiales bacterium]|nr:MAG: glycosyl transferase family 1 [Hyphomicrobiales bacterium]